MAEIYLEEKIAENGEVLLLLKGKNLSKNFLGMAFELKLPAEIKVSKFELGSAFDQLPEAQKPLVLLKENQGLWIFGLTRTAEQVAAQTSVKSELGRFIISGRAKNVVLENGVLSNLVKQEREDQENTIWSGVKFLPAEQVKAVPKAKATATKKTAAAKTTAKKTVSSVNQELTESWQEEAAPTGFWGEVWPIGQELMGSLALLTILLVSGVWWLEKRFKFLEWIKVQVRLLGKNYWPKLFASGPK